MIASNLINATSFDKTHISDTSDIRIPIYDVCTVLADNSGIHLDEFFRANARNWKSILLNCWKEYISHMTDKMEILNGDSIDRENDVCSLF